MGKLFDMNIGQVRQRLELEDEKAYSIVTDASLNPCVIFISYTSKVIYALHRVFVDSVPAAIRLRMNSQSIGVWEYGSSLLYMQNVAVERKIFLLVHST